jgi:hypothetical protein
MKQSSPMYSPLLNSSQMTEADQTYLSNTKKTNQTKEVAKSTIHTEENIIRLNRIGQEYPFCVYHKHKINDPL